MRTIILLATMLTFGCVTKTEYIEKREPMQCVVPSAAIAPVPSPRKLEPGATNEDLRNREQVLEGALEKCNARLTDVPSTVSVEPVKPKNEPSINERLRALFRDKGDSK